MGDHAVIEVKNLYKSYGKKDNRSEIFVDASLKVEEGELVALMGRSGSGKSTLLNILSGLQMPDSGSVSINGRKINYDNARERILLRRDMIGYVIQDFGLISRRSAWENVTIMVRSKKYKSDDHRLVHRLFSELGIADKENSYPQYLSNGEKQRVAIVRALIDDKKIILADEPTGALDVENAGEVMRIFRSLTETRNCTIIIATHDPEIAKSCDRIIYIKNKGIEG